MKDGAMANVDSACLAFEHSVEKLLTKLQKRHKRNNPEGYQKSEIVCKLIDEARECCQHGSHTLRTLEAKRTSLEYGLEAFSELSSNCTKLFRGLAAKKEGMAKGQNEERQGLLRHWFSVYLRLRDGFVLLESGERRHPGDGDLGGRRNRDRSTRRFWSRLAKGGSFQRDGVTRKFSSERGYTGASWDEFYDEDVGIQRRLLDCLLRIDHARFDKLTSSGKRKALWEKLLDGGADVFEMQMDRHEVKSKELRSRLIHIQKLFIEGINEILISSGRLVRKDARGSTIREKIVLVTDDKSERISLGAFEVARVGNVFMVSDAGGSLPHGMTLSAWRSKFAYRRGHGHQTSPKSSSISSSRNDSQHITRSKDKKRKIIEDSDSSSDEDINISKTAKIAPSTALKPLTLGNERSSPANVNIQHSTSVNSFHKKSRPSESVHSGLSPHATSSTTEVTKTTTSTTIPKLHDAKNSSIPQSNDDGLLIRVRNTESNYLPSKVNMNNSDDFATTHLDAIKRQHGISANQLGKGMEQLDAELARSAVLAQKEELIEGAATGEGCLVQWIKQWKMTEEMMNDGEFRELWEELRELFDRWKDDSREWKRVNQLIANNKLEFASDDAYNTRETLREINMLLGIHLLDIHSFLVSHPKLLTPTTKSPLEAAEETFRTALTIVAEHESSLNPSNVISGTSSFRLPWEKGQHFLLRGRAQTNIGRALLERTQSPIEVRCDNTNATLLRAIDFLSKAIDSAQKLRHNSVALLGLSDKCGNGADRLKWKSKAMKHTLEAIELSVLASRLCGMCFMKLDRIQEAEDVVLQYSNGSELLALAGCDGVSISSIITVLCDSYWSPMSLAEQATFSLETLPIQPLVSVINRSTSVTQRGEQLLQIVSRALKRACELSDQISNLVKEHSLDNVSGEGKSMIKDIASRAVIEMEEKVIYQLWEKKKANAQTSAVGIHRSRSNNCVHPTRRDIGGDQIGRNWVKGNNLHPPRRIFVRDSISTFKKKVTKKNNPLRKKQEEMAATNSFNSAFCVNSSSSENSTLNNLDNQPLAPKYEYRKWGDDLLEDGEADRFPSCCPAFPMDMPEDIRRSLEARLSSLP